MAYTITKTDGTILTQISDGALDESTTLKLPGPNYVGYGKALNENLVYLLENFAGNSAPLGRSIPGQLYYDINHQTLKVYSSIPGVGYTNVSGITNAGLQPEVAKDGDIWYNTSTEQASIYDNGRFKLIGPIYTKAQGVSGAIPVVVTDGVAVGVSHNIVAIQNGNTTVATFSSSGFIPSGFDPGFASINPGITLNSNIANPTLNTNIVGRLTGPVTGDVTGNVVATTLRGTLIGNVVATTVTGTLTGDTYGIHNGNLIAPYTQTTNFSTGNAQITGGNITGTYSTTTTYLYATNFSTANAQITGGYTSVNSVTGNIVLATNFSTANAVITGGYISGISNISVATATVTNLTVATATVGNLSTANAQIASGNITVTNANIANITVANLSTGNAQIAGGNISVNNATIQQGAITVLNTGNAQILGGNVSNTTGYNNSLFGANLNTSNATTANISVKSTVLATTAYVHNVIPTGAIIMYSGNTIPFGWAICNGQTVNGVTTVDLRDRFVVGAGTTYVSGESGGNSSVTLTTTQMPSHSHSVTFSSTTGSAGGHTHTVTTSLTESPHTHNFTDVYALIGDKGLGASTASEYDRNGTYIYPSFYAAGNATDYDQDNGSYGFPSRTEATSTGITASTSINAATDHTHSISLTGTTTSAGGSGPNAAIDIRPKYYALYYIQKVY